MLLRRFPFLKRPESNDSYLPYAWALAKAREHFPSRYLSPHATTDEERRERFEPIALFVSLVIWRLDHLEKSFEARAVIEVMLADFDAALRESGVGDLAVAKKIRTLAAAFNGRREAYAKALESGKKIEFQQALARNHFGDESDVVKAVEVVWPMRKARADDFLNPGLEPNKKEAKNDDTSRNHERPSGHIQAGSGKSHSGYLRTQKR